MTEKTRKLYATIAKHAEWRWFACSTLRDTYFLHVAGHRIATVKPAFSGWGAWCPGGLVGYLKTERGAKRYAVDAVRVWLMHAHRYTKAGEPQEAAP